MASPIMRFIMAFALMLSSQPSIAQETWETYNGRFCGAAANGDWDSIVDYTNVAGTDIAEALKRVRCRLSRGNSSEYIGNMLHASLRSSPDARNVFINVTRELLRETPTIENRSIFVGLVVGDGADYNIFHQIEITWNNPGRNDNAMFAAKLICMSIDRYDMTELNDIRQNECMTAPFAEPWSIE